jgi:hypothetical protein
MRFAANKTAYHREVLDASRSDFVSYDQIANTWTLKELGTQTPEAVARAAALMLAAGRPGTALAVAYAVLPSAALAPRVACTAAEQLAIRPELYVSALDCAKRPPIKVRISRQSFETDQDKTLSFAGGLNVSHIVKHGPTNQHRIFGGQGRRFLNTFSAKMRDQVQGEVVWRPERAAGTRFGVLAGAGIGTDETRVVVEKLRGLHWTEIGRIVLLGSQKELMVPHLVARFLVMIPTVMPTCVCGLSILPLRVGDTCWSMPSRLSILSRGRTGAAYRLSRSE